MAFGEYSFSGNPQRHLFSFHVPPQHLPHLRLDGKRHREEMGDRDAHLHLDQPRGGPLVRHRWVCHLYGVLPG
jgi:hypothetical protein